MTTKHLHERRGISFRELGAVLATRELLKSGLLKHIPAVTGHMPQPHAGEHEFCMLYAHVESGCGTVSCIGGTMAVVMGMNHSEAASYVNESTNQLRNLFYPGLHSDQWNKITPRRAVRAINEWLATGHVNWSKIIKTKA